jgi:hypothetical protein
MKVAGTTSSTPSLLWLSSHSYAREYRGEAFTSLRADTALANRLPLVCRYEEPISVARVTPHHYGLISFCLRLVLGV